MSTSLGDEYDNLDTDPEETGGDTRDIGWNGGDARTGFDAIPPLVGTEQAPPPSPEVGQTIALLTAMGVPMELSRFTEMAMDPRTFKNQVTYTMQLPLLMKEFASKLGKSLSVMNDELALAQVQRCMIVLIARHVPELIHLVREAGLEDQRQRRAR